MKKSLIFLFVLVLVFTLWACSNTEESEAQSLNESTTEESVFEESDIEESTTEESTTEEDSDYDVSYVYDEFLGDLKRIVKTSKEVALAEKSGTVKLTLERLIAISDEKESDISWRDFEEFISETIVEKGNEEYLDDDGILIVIKDLSYIQKTYKIDNEKSLVISGTSLSTEPQNMFLVIKDNAKNKNYSYDIRNGNIEKTLQNGIESLIQGEKVDFENRTVDVNYIETYEYFENHIGNLAKGLNGSNPVILINTREELNKMITDFKTTIAYYHIDSKAMKDIDFNKYSVLIVPVSSGSGSENISISEIRKYGNTLYLDIKSEMPEMGTDDMATWWLVSTVKKDVLEGVEKANASYRWFCKDGYEVYYSPVIEDNRPAYITCYGSRITFISGGSNSTWFYGKSWRDGDVFYISETRYPDAVFAFRLDGDTFVFEPSLSTDRAISWLRKHTTFVIEPPYERITIYYTK